MSIKATITPRPLLCLARPSQQIVIMSNHPDDVLIEPKAMEPFHKFITGLKQSIPHGLPDGARERIAALTECFINLEMCPTPVGLTPDIESTFKDLLVDFIEELKLSFPDGLPDGAREVLSSFVEATVKTELRPQGEQEALDAIAANVMATFEADLPVDIPEPQRQRILGLVNNAIDIQIHNYNHETAQSDRILTHPDLDTMCGRSAFLEAVTDHLRNFVEEFQKREDWACVNEREKDLLSGVIVVEDLGSHLNTYAAVKMVDNLERLVGKMKEGSREILQAVGTIEETLQQLKGMDD